MSVKVTMGEYAFEHAPSTAAGRVIFRAHNSGQLNHELVLVAFPPGFELSLASQLRSPDRRVFQPLAFLPRRSPAGSGTFAVDLAPGRYGLACFIVEPGEKESHALKGMTSELTVRSREAPG